MTPEERREIRTSMQDAVAPLGREIGELKESVRNIDDTLRRKQIDDAAQEAKTDEKLKDMRVDINGIGKKITAHLSEHWKHYIYSAVLVSTIMGAAKFLG